MYKRTQTEQKISIRNSDKKTIRLMKYLKEEVCRKGTRSFSSIGIEALENWVASNTDYYSTTKEKPYNFKGGEKVYTLKSGEQFTAKQLQKIIGRSLVWCRTLLHTSDSLETIKSRLLPIEIPTRPRHVEKVYTLKSGEKSTGSQLQDTLGLSLERCRFLLSTSNSIEEIKNKLRTSTLTTIRKLPSGETFTYQEMMDTTGLKLAGCHQRFKRSKNLKEAMAPNRYLEIRGIPIPIQKQQQLEPEFVKIQSNKQVLKHVSNNKKKSNSQLIAEARFEETKKFAKMTACI